MVYYSEGTCGGVARYGSTQVARASGAIPEGNHGSPAAICCRRKSNPRRARSFGDREPRGVAFPERRRSIRIIQEKPRAFGFDREARTAAHLQLPFGSKVRVTNVA